MHHSALCSVCSKELNINRMYMDNDGNITIRVNPCDDCLEEARDEGREDREYDYEE